MYQRLAVQPSALIGPKLFTHLQPVQNIKSKLIHFRNYFTLTVLCVPVLQYFTGLSCLRYYLNKQWLQFISKRTAEYTENSKHLPKHEWHFKIYASIWVKRGPFLGGPPRHTTAVNLGSRLAVAAGRSATWASKNTSYGLQFYQRVEFLTEMKTKQ